MYEESNVSMLYEQLHILERGTLYKSAKSKCYKTFRNAMNEMHNEVISHTDMVNRLVKVCIRDIRDQNNTHNVLSVLNAILKQFDVRKLSTKDLLQCFVECLNVIKTSASHGSVQTIRRLCFETIMLYPDDVFVELGKNHLQDICELLDLDHTQKQAFSLILKLLKSLPNEDRCNYVEENLNIWFTKLIPAVINIIQNEAECLPILFEILEVLVDELVKIDYADNPNWQHILECICNPAQYPSVMKNMLINSNAEWYRLWIVCIKLLKNQITRSNIKYGSPINSMLPVVEMAFKMEAASRCRAFKCWDVLIDNFQMETSDANIVKRLKLLIIPLLSNNAKIEETTLAKFNTWWHLICKFENKLEKFLDTVLFTFLRFCLGKNSSQNQSVVPGLLTINTKQRSIEAFTEIAGHLDCNRCVNLERLTCKVLTKTVLVDHWDDWIHSLKTAISIICENTETELKTQNIVCAWKSFVLTIAEMPANSIRRDLFDGLLVLLETLLKQSKADNKYAEVILQLLMTLFRDQRNYALLQEEPLHKITTILLTPAFDVFFNRNNHEDTIASLKPLAEYVIKFNPERFIKSFFNEGIISTNNLLFIWSALTEVIVESKWDCVKNLQFLLINPIKATDFFLNAKYSSLLWFKLFQFVYPKAVDSINKSLNDFVWSQSTVCIDIKLFAAIGILNYELEKDFIKSFDILVLVTSEINDYTVLEYVFTPIVESLEKVSKRIPSEKSTLARNWVEISNNVLKLINMAIQHGIKKESYITKLEHILVCLDIFLKKQSLSQHIEMVLDELINLSLLHTNVKTVHIKILDILKNCLPNLMDMTIIKRVANAINKIEPVADSANIQILKKIESDDFTTPNYKAITRRAKKREAAIVSTVVDNGEEFIVVKSNWKFNPRKLTENQKEKLQRKREDIPALYQDLSQSQDEFKLMSWKTDSQDSSSTNSTSASHSTTVNKMSNEEQVSNILKNIPSPNVVPKIISKMLTENAEASCIDKDCKSDSDNLIKSPDLSKKMVIVKDTKSPRIALKDRVIKNVKNLIEKSNTQKENNFSDSLNIDNIPKTPTSKSDDSNLVNSAPPKISADRPSRVKRKPRKFDDTEIFLLKRSRRTISQSDSQQQNDTNMIDILEEQMESDINNETCDESTKIITKAVRQVNTEMVDDTINKIVTDDKQVILQQDTISVESHLCDVQTSAKQDDLDKSDIHHVLLNDDTVDINNTPELIQIEAMENAEATISENHEGLKCDAKTIKNQAIQNQNTPVTKNKQNSFQRSRIEKELAIDTVEGHPFLKSQPEKRMTRKNVTPLNSSRRKSLTEKLNKSKLEIKRNKVQTPNSKKKDKDRTSNESIVSTDDSESKYQVSHGLSEDLPLSEDIIESSQDSTLTTISVTATKNTLKKPTVLIDKASPKDYETQAPNNTVETNKKPDLNKTSVNSEGQDDTQLPINKSVLIDKIEFDLTENIDTEPMTSEIIDHCSEVIVINDDEDSLPNIVVGTETQEIADADTLPTDYSEKIDTNDKKIVTEINIGVETQEIHKAETLQNDIIEKILPVTELQTLKDNILKAAVCNVPNSQMVEDMPDDNTANDLTKTISESIDASDSKCEMIKNMPDGNTENDYTETISESINALDSQCETVSSPLNDEEQRKKDFLDNTTEISPIKMMSPVKEKNSLSPETSSDYVVIKLSSPVQSNGEPFEKHDSPEIFTEEKISPEKRDVSPPREGNTVIHNNSPSSSLSLKKNRPQVRSGGRAAQMLGLCVPDRLQSMNSMERSEPEESKKNTPSSSITPARRNLRIFYNSIVDNENGEDNNDSESFLKFKRSLPNADSSPSVPILKRKLAEITDDTAISPACKRKRVSFHDPPVSTTISVQKYIEPCGVRSPQNSAAKRLERQNLRSQQSALKSPKRLENVFKLDTVLTKTLESFTEIDLISSDDIQSMSLDETPAVEIVKTSDLNDTDPICPDLLDCDDKIDEIAADLSSPAMKEMFLKELMGKISTVGDLAKMTELEVNRLCIKAPKVKVTKKVLNDYASKKSVPTKLFESEQIILEQINNKKSEVSTSEGIHIEIQTDDVATRDMEVQTIPKILKVIDIQTDKMELSTISVQTEESGSKTTKEIINSCLLEKPDFVKVLSENLDESSKVEIAEKLPFNTLNDVLMKNITNDNSRILLSKILETQTNSNERNTELSFLQDYICDRFESRDLIMFCSRLLAKIHDSAS